jgi:hypothetical protein
MKGIYLTEEGKKSIEDEIAELEKRIEQEKDCQSPIEYLLGEWKGKQLIYKEILSYATILPIEESWLKVAKKHGVSSILSEFYPNGVIIQQTKEQ